MAKGKAKVPKHKAVPAAERPSKQPHSIDPTTSNHFSWRFGQADRGGPFAWTALEDPAEYKAVMEHLHGYEIMEQKDRQGSGSHAIQISALSPEAKKRLGEIKQDDLDELMSFRITGRKRVFCIRERNVMRVLWYDPEHLVCPSTLKHT